MHDVSPTPPLACADVNRSTAFGRARAITAGHSVLCSCAGISDACPMRTGQAAPPTDIRAALMVMNEALERARMMR